MSGVIDKDGQWEHCNQCGKWVLLQNLRYEKPSAKWPSGRDLCMKCAGEDSWLQEMRAKQANAKTPQEHAAITIWILKYEIKRARA